MGGCYSLRKYISDFLENKLEPELRTTIENHLKLCPKCQHTVKSLGYIQDHLSKLQRHQCSDGFTRKLQDRIHSPQRSVPVSFSVRKFSYAFAGVLIVFLSIYTVQWINNQPEEVIIPASSVIESTGNEEEAITNANQQDVNIKTKEAVAGQDDSLKTRENSNGRIKYVDQQ